MRNVSHAVRSVEGINRISWRGLSAEDGRAVRDVVEIVLSWNRGSRWCNSICETPMARSRP